MSDGLADNFADIFDVFVVEETFLFLFALFPAWANGREKNQSPPENGGISRLFREKRSVKKGRTTIAKKKIVLAITGT